MLLSITDLIKESFLASSIQLSMNKNNYRVFTEAIVLFSGLI